MKYLLNILILILITVIITDCHDNEISITKINVSTKSVAGSFSSIISSYEVVPLDNNPEAYFRFSHKIISGENLWLFCNPNDAKVIAFNDKGKFLYTIGKKGRGPGEANYINDFNYNPLENSITIYERSKAKKYLLNGSFIGEDDMGFIPTKVTNFADNQFIIEKHLPTGDSISDFEIRLVDKNLQTIAKRLPQKNFNYFGSSLYGQLSRCQTNQDYAYYFSLSGDTIFHISNGRIFPAYLLSYDKDIFIQQVITESNPGMDSDEKKDIYEQIHYFENEENCFVFFQNNRESFCLIFNIETNHSRLFKNAIYPAFIKENHAIALTNSFQLEELINNEIDPNRNKCVNPFLLDSLITNGLNDFQVILKLELNLN